MATHSSILAGEFHGQRRLVGYSPWGGRESDMTEKLSSGRRERWFDFTDIFPTCTWVRPREEFLPQWPATTGLQKHDCVVGEMCNLPWAVITKEQQIGDLNNHLFLMVLRPGKSEVSASADWESSKDQLPGS